MTIYKKMSPFIFLSILFSFISSFEETKNIPVFDQIKVEGGYISGTTNSTGDIHIYKGIPFAAPPIGYLRWKAPQAVQSWNGTKVCDRYSASPMQAKPAPFSMWSEEFLIPKEPISEDCLYLN